MTDRPGPDRPGSDPSVRVRSSGSDPSVRIRPSGSDPSGSVTQPAGLPDYLKEAFLFRWNLLFFLGGTAAAALTPLAPVLLPLVAAGELMYLTGLISVTRFRA